MLAGLETIFRMRAENKGLDLVFEIAYDVPRYIQTDQGKLRQVIINLLSNAIKFTEAGQVLLQVSPSGDTLHFEVKDTGVGIDAAGIDRLFEPFSQTQSGLRLGQGSGLGLPISRQYVQLLGGDISVQSKPGLGSTFAFDIDYETVEAMDITPEHSDQRVTGLAAEQPAYRILIVEDSPENRLLLRQLLEIVGFEVRTANNGQEALAEYEAWQPHLIWMDIRMPVMDGYEATRLIKAGDGPDTKIIAITASVFEEEREQVLAAGCDDFVRKPFQESEIFDVMAEQLGLEYVYETAESGTPEIDEVSLTVEDLADLPGEWCEALRGAATRGRTQQLFDLITEVESEYPEVAQGLRAMVDELAFKEIVALTEPEESHG
jgi:CheY-like chemotaxis protein